MSADVIVFLAASARLAKMKAAEKALEDHERVCVTCRWQSMRGKCAVRPALAAAANEARKAWKQR